MSSACTRGRTSIECAKKDKDTHLVVGEGCGVLAHAKGIKAEVAVAGLAVEHLLVGEGLNNANEGENLIQNSYVSDDSQAVTSHTQAPWQRAHAAAPSWPDVDLQRSTYLCPAGARALIEGLEGVVGEGRELGELGELRVELPQSGVCIILSSTPAFFETKAYSGTQIQNTNANANAGKHTQC